MITTLPIHDHRVANLREPLSKPTRYDHLIAGAEQPAAAVADEWLVAQQEHPHAAWLAPCQQSGLRDLQRCNSLEASDRVYVHGSELFRDLLHAIEGCVGEVWGKGFRYLGLQHFNRLDIALHVPGGETSAGLLVLGPEGLLISPRVLALGVQVDSVAVQFPGFCSRFAALIADQGILRISCIFRSACAVPRTF
jgi:hypothetical protein